MPPERCTIRVDGQPVEVREGVSLAAALANVGTLALRRAPSGALRGALCGMGSCYECRVRVDGREGVRACQTPCYAGMEVEIDG